MHVSVPNTATPPPHRRCRPCPFPPFRRVLTRFRSPRCSQMLEGLRRRALRGPLPGLHHERERRRRRRRPRAGPDRPGRRRRGPVGHQLLGHPAHGLRSVSAHTHVPAVPTSSRGTLNETPPSSVVTGHTRTSWRPTWGRRRSRRSCRSTRPTWWCDGARAAPPPPRVGGIYIVLNAVCGGPVGLSSVPDLGFL